MQPPQIIGGPTQPIPGVPGGLKIEGAEAALFQVSGEGSAARIPLLYIDPLWDNILVLFPQDNPRELNRRLRHYYKYQPLIRSIIDFHTETPLSDFYLEQEDCNEAQEYYNDFKDRKNLPDMITDISRDYWALGEGFAYGNWNDFDLEYEDFVQIPPEELEIHSAIITNKRVYVLRPNREYGKLMRSSNPADRMLAKYISESSPEYSQSLSTNSPHPLDSDRLIVLQRKMAGYSNRGISPLLSVVKDLHFEDHLNMFRMVFIQRHSYPLKLYKIGDKEKGWIPPEGMYAAFRQQLAAAINDPDYNLITHPFLTVEYVTGHDKTVNLIPLYELVKQRIFAGLFVSDAIISGEKTPYGSGVTFMRGLMGRYQTHRNNIESEVRRKIFLPLARMRGFTIGRQADADHGVRTSRDRRPALPKFFWQKANLLANQQIINTIINMRDKGDVPFKVIAELMGWDYDAMLSQLKKEQGTPLDSAWRKARDKFISDKPQAAKDLLDGKTIEEILKKMATEDLSTEKKEGPADRIPDIKKPELPVMPEVTARPPGEGRFPAEAPPAPPGGGAAERAPRPAEAPTATPTSLPAGGGATPTI